MTIHATLRPLLLVLCLLVPVVGARAQEGAEPLRVGLRVAAPFVVEDDAGEYDGLAIEAWRAAAAELGREAELEPAELGTLLEGLESGAYDLVVGALTVTPEREAVFDFSHPLLSSGLGIAVRSRGTGVVAAILRAVLSVEFLRAVGALALLLLAVGLVVWLAERRRNREQFAEGPVGLLDGFWFSAVTMTTVGYGDKAPTTRLGRAVTLVWMFASILLISGFTGAIASSLTVDSLGSRIQDLDDLERARVAVLSDSAGETWAEDLGFATVGFASVDDALDALAAEEVDAVVHDQPILRFRVRRRPGAGLAVLPQLVARQDLAFGLPSGSPLREPLNRALLEVLGSTRWQRERERWLGE